MHSELISKIFVRMFSKTNRQIQPSFCRLAYRKPIYLPSTFRCNRNGRFVENRKESSNIWLCLRKGIQATPDPGGLFKLKLSTNDQSIMVFLSNYDRSNFLSYFPFSDLISDCIWIERRNR